MNVGSLFAGIGGFDLGFERCGMHTVWQVEQDPYCLAVLEKNFPDAQRYTDVRDVGAHNLEPVDLICGGFPCQDISLAGRGAGIDGARSGLWSEFARVIGELGPRYAVVENVPALASRGLDRVLRDLAALGYDAEWDCLPASAFGAPHQRDRFWLVAYPNSDGVRLISERDQREGWEVRAALGGYAVAAHDGSARYLANAYCTRRGQRWRSESVRAQQPAAERGGEALADPARDAEAGPTSSSRAERERAGEGGERSPAGALPDTDARGLTEHTQQDGESQRGEQAQGRHDVDGLRDTVADSHGERAHGSGQQRGWRGQPQDCGGAGGRPVSNADGAGPQRGLVDGLGERPATSCGGPVESDVCRVADGLSQGLDGDPWREEWPGVPRVSVGVPNRVDRLSTLGNALVPQIAEWIGARICEYEAGR